VISNSKYLALASRRKMANWEADYVTAEELYKEMREMVKKGEVSDEEMSAAAYV